MYPQLLLTLVSCLPADNVDYKNLFQRNEISFLLRSISPFRSLSNDRRFKNKTIFLAYLLVAFSMPETSSLLYGCYLLRHQRIRQNGKHKVVSEMINSVVLF